MKSNITEWVGIVARSCGSYFINILTPGPIRATIPTQTVKRLRFWLKNHDFLIK